MDGMVWLFPAFILASVAFGVVVAGLRRRLSGLDLNVRHCSNCQTPMSLRRVSIFQSYTLRGAWMCPDCGNRIKSDNRVSKTA
jgi:hypothetical protein